jgi:hypothetical protein
LPSIRNSSPTGFSSFEVVALAGCFFGLVAGTVPS